MDLPLVKSYLIRPIKATFVFLWKFLVAAVLFLFSIVFLYFSPQLALQLIPYLLLIFLVLRLLQFIAHNGDTYKNVTQFKHLIRICLFIALFTVQCGISLDLVSYQPHQDRFPFDLHNLALHLSKKNYILFRYVFCFVVYFLVHDFGIKQTYDGSNLPAIQALTEIIDFIILFWEDDIFSLDLDYSPRVLVEERPIEIKYILAALLKHSGLMKILGVVLVRYDLFILCTEVVVCYVLRSLFKRSSRRSYHRATSTIEGWNTSIAKLFYRKQAVYFVNGTKNTFGFFFGFLLVYKACSHYLASFFLTQTKLLGPEEYGDISKRFEKFKDLEDSTYNILFLFLILWIIKTILLLAWESRTIYDRLRSRILSVSEQLYFFGILDCRDQNIFNVQHRTADQTTDEGTNTEDESLIGWIIQVMIQAINVVVDIIQTSSLMSLHGVTAKKRWRYIKRNKIKDELLWKKYYDPTLDDLQQMAQHILVAKKNLSDNYFSAILSLVDTKGKNRNIRKTLQQLISWGNEYKEDGYYFVRVLLKINADVGSDNSRTRLVSKKDKQKKMEVVSLTDFRTWMEKAHDNVASLANTLTSAKELTEGLNKVVSVFLIGATVMAWLKALKIAEISKDFALIASPFFAASFFIKDTLKDSFERIFFVYVIHPFDIGDLCLIDGKNKMEVVAMGLWTTTFLAMDEDGKRKRRETVIYPNSKLSKVKIIKLKQNLIGITR